MRAESQFVGLQRIFLIPQYPTCADESRMLLNLEALRMKYEKARKMICNNATIFGISFLIEWRINPTNTRNTLFG